MRSFLDRLLSFGRVKEQIRVVCWVLRLNEAVELFVFGSFLAKDRVAGSRRLGREVLEIKKKPVYHRSFGPPLAKHTGGTFFSAWRYSFAIASMFACVAASNCLLSSGLLVSKNTYVTRKSSTPMILSAMSCCEHSGCAARRGVIAAPERTPQTWPGQAALSLAITGGCSCSNRRGFRKTALPLLSDQSTRPSVRSDRDRVANIVSERIAPFNILKQQESGRGCSTARAKCNEKSRKAN